MESSTPNMHSAVDAFAMQNNSQITTDFSGSGSATHNTLNHNADNNTVDESTKTTTRAHSYLALPEELRIIVLSQLLCKGFVVSLQNSYAGSVTIPRDFLLDPAVSGLIRANRQASLDVQFVFLEVNTIKIEHQAAVNWFQRYLFTNPRLLRAVRSIAVPNWIPTHEPTLPARAIGLFRQINALKVLKIGIFTRDLCDIRIDDQNRGVWLHTTRNISAILRRLVLVRLPLLTTLERVEIRIRGSKECQVHTQSLIKDIATYLVVEFARLYDRKLDVHIDCIDAIHNRIVEADDIDTVLGPVGALHRVV